MLSLYLVAYDFERSHTTKNLLRRTIIRCQSAYRILALNSPSIPVFPSMMTTVFADLEDPKEIEEASFPALCHP